MQCDALKAKQDMEQVDLDACRVDTLSPGNAAFSLNQTICAVTDPVYNTHPCAGDETGFVLDTLEFYNAASPSTDYTQTFSPWNQDLAFSGRAEEITFSPDDYCAAQGFSGDSFLNTRAENYMCENTNERLD